ncbi:MAG: hypothetical protein N3G75_03680 [Methanothrix sp.]|nr:hypothetical protein [Methanothrix sp.]MCX8206914.1 hypothetical protein [Methanothrix sp.]
MRYIAIMMLFMLVMGATAHQPFFEDVDITSEDPWFVADPTISTAIYATLDGPEDVDYYSFNATRGQTVLLSMVIPQIEGHENFTPMMALMGRGLAPARPPDRVFKPEGYGTMVLMPPVNASVFFEPFTRTSYWTRQRELVKIPADGQYLVAVWDAAGRTGRYVFVIGDREVPGGDLAFPLRIRGYWRPPEEAKQNMSRNVSTPIAQPSPGAAAASICMLLAFLLKRKR